MNKTNSSALIEAMTRARSYLVDAVTDDNYPHPDAVESLAILTEALWTAGEEPSSNIGRRIRLNDGREGIISGQFTWKEPASYNVFVEGEGEIFDLVDEDDDGVDDCLITEDDFEFVEEFNG